MTMPTGLDDRMKWYEGRESSRVFLPGLPVIARLDGRAFHTYTAGLRRPFDERLHELFVDVTTFLVSEADNCRCGYTQSDEISLVFWSDDRDSEIFFAGRQDKMISVLASMATARFNERSRGRLVFELLGRTAYFDCRVFQVPSEAEAVNCLIWREQDATRNSLQMTAQAYYSPKELHGANSATLNELLFARGVNWSDYPRGFKRGTYVRRRALTRPFTPDELQLLPEKHAARRNPDLVVRRTVVAAEDFPKLTRIVNREDVILRGAEPLLKSEEDAA